jgi:glycosyltransferase involved in cell wall biosynthesis
MKNLLLMLSFNGSLQRWHDAGVLSREMALYVEHLERNHAERVSIYTYGHDDASYLKMLDCDVSIQSRFDLVAPRRRRDGRLAALQHSFDAPLLFGIRKSVDVVKTNQISGSWSALILRCFGVRLFARCGYLLSRRHWLNGKWLQAAVSWIVELLLFNAASCVSVTTASARATVTAMRLGRKGCFIAPTYVDTDVFVPSTDGTSAKSAIFVGRLEPQKNVLALVEAAHLSKTPLVIVGDGSLKSAVQSRIAELGADVTMISKLQNTEIAALFKTHRYFILPSLQEGLPKVLIEAMSAGMVCVGTPIPGTQDLIEDGRTGYLATSTSAQAIADSLLRAQADSGSANCASAARDYALTHHSLQSYAARENSELQAI